MSINPTNNINTPAVQPDTTSTSPLTSSNPINENSSQNPSIPLAEIAQTINSIASTQLPADIEFDNFDFPEENEFVNANVLELDRDSILLSRGINIDEHNAEMLEIASRLRLDEDLSPPTLSRREDPRTLSRRELAVTSQEALREEERLRNIFINRSFHTVDLGDEKETPPQSSVVRAPSHRIEILPVTEHQE